MNPDNFYEILKYQDKGFIILKPYGNICHILDVFGESAAVIYLLNASKKLCKSHNWEALTIWCADNEIFKNEIVSTGFVPSEKYMKSIALISVNINAKENIAFNKTHFPTGVEEGY